MIDIGNFLKMSYKSVKRVRVDDTRSLVGGQIFAFVKCGVYCWSTRYRPPSMSSVVGAMLLPRSSRLPNSRDACLLRDVEYLYLRVLHCMQF